MLGYINSAEQSTNFTNSPNTIFNQKSGRPSSKNVFLHVFVRNNCQEFFNTVFNKFACLFSKVVLLKLSQFLNKLDMAVLQLSLFTTFS